MAPRSDEPHNSTPDTVRPLEQTLSVVIPVFRCGDALSGVVAELLNTAERIALARDVTVLLDEILLVCDNPWLPPSERSRLLDLEAGDRRVRVIWLTRNFGQHLATVAGIVSTSGDWVATMDEDGQHDPAQLAAMLRVAAQHGTSLVYAKPTNPPPHGALRNAASALAKRVFRLITGAHGHFHSFRLIEGAVARSACAYMGENVYLDVAMHWSCGDAGLCPMRMRNEGSKSSYNYRRLIAHFGRMVLSSGARPLRLIAAFGVFVGIGGLGLAAFVAQRRLTGEYASTPGWASEIVTLLMLFAVLFVTLATLAEYLSFVAGNSIGKPLYVIAEPAPVRALWNLQAALAEASQDSSVTPLAPRRRSTRRRRV
jgi:undecaprenyl-phosphate 4-deoxy-4-formamido-L-arabinose transferase